MSRVERTIPMWLVMLLLATVAPGAIVAGAFWRMGKMEQTVVEGRKDSDALKVEVASALKSIDSKLDRLVTRDDVTLLIENVVNRAMSKHEAEGHGITGERFQRMADRIDQLQIRIAELEKRD